MMTMDGRLTIDQRVARSLKGFGLGGTLSLILVLGSVLIGVPIAALIVLVWAWLSYTPLSEIGLKRPKSWLGALVVGVVVGIGLKLLMKSVLLPYLGAPPTNAAFHSYQGDLRGFLIEVPQLIVLVGFAEELVFRGYLINRLQAVFGTSAVAGIAAVIVSAAIFGPLHYFMQGYWGALQATIIGIVFAGAYLLNGQRLWSLIFAHSAFDIFAFWIIYAGMEENFAHLVFP
ncbi:MAG: CPBP family intramembrane metalloprotease [Alphaproteobacteria bacterium]|nr:CPBP family intramembrane metalloprotease [Alphaproteobacteria bacterium]